MRAGDLRPNPKNWRTHPEGQQDALRGVLAEVGIADALLARELPDGSLMLVDGHLRAEVDPDTEWPVLVLDVTEAEADLLLATVDPLAGLAEADPAKVADLLAGIEASSDAVQALLDGLGAEEEINEQTYTNKIVAPVYEPKGEKPPLSALIDRDKTQELLADINVAELPDDVKEFLRLAAERHTVFNFRQIAEFYCHADAILQNLMERSGLIIIDFDKAIEYGFVHLTERLGALADQEAFNEG